MPQPLLWLLALGPLALAAVAALPTRWADRHPARAATAAFAAGLVTLALTLAAIGLLLATADPVLRTGTTGIAGIGFALQFDALSATAGLLVAFVGTVVIHFSRNYLDGEPGHGRFIQRLSLTLASVLLLILSGNLFQLALAWVATSLGLHGLLLFYRGRPAAILAARKKFLASRIGDLCLLGVMLLAYRQFGSLDYAVMAESARSLADAAATPGALHAMAALLVVAALLKSAQFPLHGWLLEVMETPTPVSALLHAGIINAGGFLLLRFADILVLSGPALDGLLLAGGVTALFGSLVMMTQTSVKTSLAYSTVAQMGFMMLQIGLGAFSAALLHLVAHSLYKAHAFLSSGSAIDTQRVAVAVNTGRRPHPIRLLLAMGLVLAATMLAGWLYGATPQAQPGAFVLTAILMLGLTHLVGQAFDGAPSPAVVLRVLLLALAVAVAYFGLQWLASRLGAGVLPASRPLRGAFDVAVVAAVVSGFAAITFVQGLLADRIGSPRWQRWYAHISNGFYVNTVANRWVLRYWPTGTRRALESTATFQGN